MAKQSIQSRSQDWDWVGTEIQSASQITLSHRRRAAGLSGAKPCLLDSQKDDKQKNSSTSRLNKKGKDSLCKARSCRKNYQCYNWLKMEHYQNPGARKDYVYERMGAVSEEREGPAGLLNLGATCYTSPLYHLALVFAMLEYSDRRIVDPLCLIHALRLKESDQQDAAEFSKLFLSLIASEFSKHANLDVRSLVTDQFEGTMRYITQCECGYESATETTFLELELDLQDNTTLQNQLETMMQPELLDDDNRYNCPQCQQNRKATRRQVPVKLPPVIHFSLMRFVYDSISMSRKKINANIKYPKEIVLGNSYYDLRGVISHTGSSAHYGHFICETYDEIDDTWYICDDELVISKPERPRKKTRLNRPNSGDNEESSKDAYMLVYSRRDGKIFPREPPKNVMNRVEEENALFRQQRDKEGVQMQAFYDEWEHIKGAKMDFVKSLPGTDYIVPREALLKWMETKEFQRLYVQFDYSSILCSHFQIDPTKTFDVLTISWNAHEKLTQYFDPPEIDICRICIEKGFMVRLDKARRQAVLARFNELNSLEEADQWCLPKLWLSHWRNGKLPPDALPISEDYTLLCPHNEPSPKMPAWTTVNSQALAFLQSIFGPFPSIQSTYIACPTCSQDADADIQKIKDWKSDVKIDRLIKRNLDPSPPAFGIDYYVLPETFLKAWGRYTKAPGEKRPSLQMNLCQHGLLDFDPQMEKPRIINEAGWKLICQKYGNHVPITVKFGAKPTKGKRTTITSFSPAVCEPCRVHRLSSYTEVCVSIVLRAALEDADDVDIPPKRIFSYSYRSLSKSYQVYTSGENSVLSLKANIFSQTGLVPLLQDLYYKNRKLDNEETLIEMGYLNGDEMTLIQVEEDKQFDEDSDKVNEKEGFGDTGLLFRITCPDCTYENEGTANCCKLCSTLL
ncbi:uncharacterized protein L203_102930 [Cryptococcus depauperatus CBS 7841]|uniref:ubiquitinyl hydrolase 1 n=1 Tax=Cryptococcus depauperatus CBS 7841 TaxID=1295531 RepID=A0AAJ8M0S3_9TREE